MKKKLFFVFILLSLLLTSCKKNTEVETVKSLSDKNVLLMVTQDKLEPSVSQFIKYIGVIEGKKAEYYYVEIIYKTQDISNVKKEEYIAKNAGFFGQITCFNIIDKDNETNKEVFEEYTFTKENGEEKIYTNNEIKELLED